MVKKDKLIVNSSLKLVVSIRKGNVNNTYKECSEVDDYTSGQLRHSTRNIRPLKILAIYLMKHRECIIFHHKRTVYALSYCNVAHSLSWYLFHPSLSLFMYVLCCKNEMFLTLGFFNKENFYS